jgi:hypothetical protein
MGPGKYDDLATYVRETAQANGVAVIIIGGNKGSGFSIQNADASLTEAMPMLLRRIADEIEKDMAPQGGRQ